MSSLEGLQLSMHEQTPSLHMKFHLKHVYSVPDADIIVEFHITI